MNGDKSKCDADGQLKNGIFKEFFKDGALSCVGKYRNGEKIGEWRTYDAKGKLTKTTRHKRG